jgi:hypothetical protein
MKAQPMNMQQSTNDTNIAEMTDGTGERQGNNSGESNKSFQTFSDRRSRSSAGISNVSFHSGSAVTWDTVIANRRERKPQKTEEYRTFNSNFVVRFWPANRIKQYGLQKAGKWAP